MTFSLANVPTGHKIIGARFYLYGYTKSATAGNSPAIALTLATPTNPGAITASDFDKTLGPQLSDAIPYASFQTSAYNPFPLLDSALQYMAPGQIFSLALREANYDIAEISPPWYNGSIWSFYGYSMDHPDPAVRPYLLIAYQ
jgi:hypothetical protein